MPIIHIRVVRRHQLDTPLMVFNGGPFQNVELMPYQARFLAAALGGVADAVEEEDVTADHWRPRSITLNDAYGDLSPESTT